MCQEAAQRLNTLKHAAQGLNTLKHETQAQSSSAELKRKGQAQRSSAELKHKTQAQNSSTNGGDASRVGKRRNKELNPTLYYANASFSPTRDASPPLEIGVPIRDWSLPLEIDYPPSTQQKSAFRNARSSIRNALFILQFQVTHHTWVRLEIYVSNVYS